MKLFDKILTKWDAKLEKKANEKCCCCEKTDSKDEKSGKSEKTSCNK